MKKFNLEEGGSLYAKDGQFFSLQDSDIPDDLESEVILNFYPLIEVEGVFIKSNKPVRLSFNTLTPKFLRIN